MAASKSVDSVPETGEMGGQLASEERLSMDQPVVQQSVSSHNKHRKKRQRSTDELSLVVSIKRSKLALLNVEQKTTKLKKKKKKTDLNEHSFKISISRNLLNHNKLSSPQSDYSPPVPVVRQEVVPTPVVDEPVKKSKKHKDKKEKRRMLLPVQGTMS